MLPSSSGKRRRRQVCCPSRTPAPASAGASSRRRGPPHGPLPEVLRHHRLERRHPTPLVHPSCHAWLGRGVRTNVHPARTRDGVRTSGLLTDRHFRENRLCRKRDGWGGRRRAVRSHEPRRRKGPTMTEQETRAILTLCLMAAFADGVKDERERAEIRRIADGLAPGSALTCRPWFTRRVAQASRSGVGGRRLDYARAASSSPTRWRCACAMPTARRAPPRPRSWSGCARYSGWRQRPPGPSTDQAAAVVSVPLSQPEVLVARAGGHRRARQDDPQLLDSQRRARAAAAVAGLDGDHPAADEDGLSRRQDLRLRAGPRPHQGPAGDPRRGPDRSTWSRSAAS